MNASNSLPIKLESFHLSLYCFLLTNFIRRSTKIRLLVMQGRIVENKSH